MQDYLDILSSQKTGQKLTNHARNTLLAAVALAADQNLPEALNFHLFCSIFQEKGSMGAVIMKDLGIKKEHIRPFIKKKTSSRIKKSREKTGMSVELRKTLARSFSIARDLQYSFVGTEHLTYSLLDSPDEIIKKIIAKTTKPSKVTRKSSFFSKRSLKPKTPNDLKNLLTDIPELHSLSEVIPGLPLVGKSAQNGSVTPYLDKFCTNLNDQMRNKKEIIIGRQEEIGRVINVIGRKSKNNPLLIGYPGVGKTALVEKLASLINSEDVPAFMHGKKIMSLDVASIVAGTSFRGEFEMRLKEIIKEVSSTDDIILFIDEIHNIVGAGNTAGSLDLANIIKPALSKGEIRLIGATTFKEYKQHIEKDAALERRFQTITVKEPSPEETKQILFGIKKDYENFHNVNISDEAINFSVDLSCRYIQDRFLPDKAIDALDETASYARSKEKISDFSRKIKELKSQKAKIILEKEKSIIQENYDQAMILRKEEKQLEEKIKFLETEQKNTGQKERINISASDVIRTIANISGIPEEKISKFKSQKIKNITTSLGSRIIGQKEAIKKLGAVLTRSQLGIGHPERPMGSFLFLGPSGVGKTLASKVLAQEFFGSEENLVRFDMSEFIERHSVSALIGSPAGYVGYGEGGRLTEKVRRHPYSVVLFDEIEKAHGDVFNILLQILEDGTLSDAQGLKVNFKNSIIILTTNIGTEEFNAAVPTPLGFSLENKKSFSKTCSQKEDTRKAVMQKLEKIMRPELLNRLDHILVFDHLAPKDMRRIAEIELEDLRKRLEKQGLILSFSKKAADFLAQKSFAKNQGARLIRKNIQEMVENEIARMMIKDKIKNNMIAIEAEKEKLRLI